MQLARDYAEANDLDLDENLTYEDRGVSAYHSKHREEGELGKLISAVKSGAIPEGSVILIEALDRLSRDKVDEAYDQFRKILKLGVSIVTLQDRKEYTAGGMSENFGDLMISLVMMFRSHEESLMKSKRLKAAWKSKHEKALRDGTPITAITPGWIELKDGKYKIIHERAEVVERIFQLYIEGHGAGVISKILNREGVEPFNRNSKNGWYGKTIHHTLKSISTIGHHQPFEYIFDEKTRKRKRRPIGEPIKGLFPAVISPETFQAAMKVRKSRVIPKGNRGKTASNLFTGVAVCGHCGSAMHSINKGKGQQYLVCSAARRKHNTVCRDNYHWRYQEVEKAVLDSIEEVTFTQLFPDLHTDQRQVEIRLEKRMLKLERQLEEVTTEKENVMKLLIKMPDNDSWLTVFKEKEAEEIKLKSALETATEALAQAKTAQHTFKGDLDKAKAAIKRMREIMAREGDDTEKYQLRVRLQMLLKSHLPRLVCLPCPNHTPIKIWLPEYPEMTDSATDEYVDEEFNPVAEENVWITEKECAGVLWAMFQAGESEEFTKSHRIIVRREKPYKHPTRSKKAYDNRFKDRPEDSRYISPF